MCLFLCLTRHVLTWNEKDIYTLNVNYNDTLFILYHFSLYPKLMFLDCFKVIFENMSLDAKNDTKDFVLCWTHFKVL